ncbi:PREDICTED: kielin/chordin-like protein isoform X2 [Amphimedon queenslandica]|uniref:Thyroglobulin type-1 domain-containing protein n=1 Tax=Amphimedon queenslandica TaxID=400682 RepID=A0AAN0IX25_AMPQE|nr:PREDICTED: kielin/chordin-like protein isoform X2 [Amphimedon queenslandica]|eukprot:XP_019849112.1 PREDICTED: kielin/chordin-like protein isoform X2 [Amphimedon queenslandica]
MKVISSTVLFLSLVAAVISTSQESSTPAPSATPVPACTNGKRYTECGTECPLTCENKDKNIVCPDVCVAGCFCPTGMVLHNGVCVEPSQCPSNTPTCTNGKSYTECGTECPLTCENKDKHTGCADVCVAGCFCPTGMVLLNDACVEPSQCPSNTPTCTNGKRYTECGTECPLTCENKDKNIICPLVCVAGCFCPTGMVLLNDACVEPSQCPVSNTTTTSTPTASTIKAPYVEPPMSCPAIDKRGACIIEAACAENADTTCDSGKLCCSNGCGTVCTTGLLPSPLCTAVKLKATNSSSGLLGAYIPQCKENGDFSEIQCHEGYCWCVDVKTGKATTQPARSHPVCNATTTTAVTCKSGGNTYAVGDSFKATDGCNTCHCTSTGVAACTMMACLPPHTTTSPPAITAPYIDPPLMCPNVTGNVGLCAIDLACTGTTNRTCDSGSLCCFNGCSRVCTTGVTPSPLCSAVKLKATNSSSGLLGAYIPQCKENGDFSEIQCHEGYCWCVDVKTGKATTQPARSHPVCNATTTTAVTCKSGGNTYAVGESFKATDGCNTCHCTSTGVAACTMMACLPPHTTTSPPAITAPYIDPPLMCPNVTGNVGLCAIDLACTGTTNRTCDSGKLCCSNGCSRVCTTGVTPSPLCSAVKLKATNSSSGLLGAYIPQCKENGDFSEIQCHEGYCWCVDVKTGKATTQPARSHPVCNATTTTAITCKSGGNTYAVGDSFKATDGCNTCHCTSTGVAACTMMACLPPHTTTSPPAITAPYIDPPLMCPNVTGNAGICSIDPACTGTTNRTCDSGSLCCSNGCSRVCTTGVTPSPLCSAVKLKATNSSSGLLGAYIPQCKENGDFSEIQCHEGYCWCVDVKTGKATTQPARSKPVCHSTTTTDSSDSTSSLPDYCKLSPVVGNCRGSIPSYFYNSTSSKCESFTYGGCGGNDNRFSTQLACLEACAGVVVELPSVPANLSHVDMCPTPDPSQSVVGACEEECSADSSCEETEKCCSNGCGHSCTTSTSIPYYKPPMSCPPINPILGVFCSIDFGCKSHAVCQEDELCCPTGCGSMCMKGVKPTPLCPAVVNSTQSTNGLLIGAYTPQCDAKGDFSSVQCHGSTGMCWCVNTTTGKPTSSPVMHQQPECDVEGLNCNGIMCDWPNCGDGIKPISDDKHCCPYCPPPSSTSCTINGVSHPNNSTFTAPDGCNTCHCTNGVTGCTRMLCPPCVVDGVSHASGSSFTAPDGCNTCTCYNGMAACTEMACPPCNVGGKNYASGTNFKAPDGCNTCFCSNGIAVCTEKACLPVCSAGNMSIPEGRTINDGCSVCSCKDLKITCTKSKSCHNPITKVLNVTMRFTGDYDSLTANPSSFKLMIKESLVAKYASKTGLQKSQIKAIYLSRGSVIITVTLKDGSDSANVTHLLIQMEQDYKNKTLVIIYQNTTLTPTGDFHYSQSGSTSELDNNGGDKESDDDGGMFFWIYVSAAGLLFVVLIVLAVLTIFAFKKKNQHQFRHHRLPMADVHNDEVSFVKGYKPMTIQMETI